MSRAAPERVSDAGSSPRPRAGDRLGLDGDASGSRPRLDLGGAGRTVMRAGVAVGLLWLLVLPLVGASDSTMFTLTLMFTSVAVAVNWNLTGGFVGYVDFGHAVWFGIGGYVTVILMSQDANSLSIGWSPIPAILAGSAVAGLLAAAIGRATMRLRGPYFSVAMLGTFVAMREIVRTWGGLTGGGVGLTLPPYLNRPLFYYLELVLVVALVALVWWLRRTRFGAALVAIRDDELGAEMRGIATTRLKVVTFSFAGASTGLFGGLWAFQNTFVDPDIAFTEVRTIDAVMGTLLGGIGTVAGPVVGSVALYWLREVLWANLLDYHLIVQGVLLILIVLLVPRGIVGLFDRSATSLSRIWSRSNTGVRDKDAASNRDTADHHDLADTDRDKDAEGNGDTADGHDTAGASGSRNTADGRDAISDSGPGTADEALDHGPLDVAALRGPTGRPSSVEPALALQGSGIVKRFGGLTAVADVDIAVSPGEMVGLIGPNGSGKTTLFDCLSRVTDIDAGTVRFNGSDITRLPPHRVARLGVSRTFQVIRVYRELTVRENMELSIQWGRIGLRDLFGRTDFATRHKAEGLLEFLLLASLADEPAGNLSGGQLRLLEIGMALMSDPSLILLDEATAGVNPTLVEHIKDRLKAVNSRDGVAFLLVEHNVNFVADLCDRVVVLETGAKLAEGTPSEVMEDPAVIEAYFGAAAQKAKEP